MEATKISDLDMEIFICPVFAGCALPEFESKFKLE